MMFLRSNSRVVPIINFMCRIPVLRHPKIIAPLLSILIRNENPNLSFQKETILVLSKPGAVQDIMVSFARQDVFDIAFAPKGMFKILGQAFLPNSLDDNNYISSDPTVEERKKIYREYVRQILILLRKRCNLATMVSGNFAYFSEREVHAAATEIDLPFIVLHKENLKSPGRKEYYKDLYEQRRGPYTGAHIIVYNETERAIQIEAGIVTADRVTVCGMPRLDASHASRTHLSGMSALQPPTVLFFAFGPKTGFPVRRRKLPHQTVETIGDERDFLSWDETHALTYDALAAFAVRNPAVTVLVKSKVGLDSRSVFEQAFQKLGTACPQNITFIEGGDPHELIERAWVTIGMNSTALLESLAMGKHVLTLAFGEAALATMANWIADFGSCVEKVTDPSLLIERLETICTSPAPKFSENLSDETKKALNKWAGNSDGCASERVRACFLHVIKSNRA